MQQRTQFQKFLMVLNLTLILTILAVGSDVLVQQNNLTGRKNTVEQREARIEQLAINPPTPPPEDIIKKIPTDRPIQVEIPNIGIASEVVSVGVNASNAMEVPSDASKVGWYYHGVKPGETGGAILTAHYDTPSGKPAVFYNLRKVNRGDLVFVRMANNEELLFQVQDVISEPVKTFPTDLIFGTFTTKDLILITCDGIWNPVEHSYSKRLVVFATLWENKTL